MLKQSNCVKRFDGADIDSLQANAGESFLIKRLYVIPAAGNGYLTLKVDRKTVGVYRIAGRSGNHLDYMRGKYIYKNLMEFLASKDINCTIPVAEGQVFTVSTLGTAPVVVIVYDTYDAGDITAAMFNGTESKEYMFIQYMDNAEEHTVAGNVLLDTSLSPAEFPDFPCGKSVPANTEIEIAGLVGSPVGDGYGSGAWIGSSYVKLVKERETLFDEDRNGIPFFYKDNSATAYMSLFSLIGACTSSSLHWTGEDVFPDVTLGDPLIFDPRLVFRAGEELLVYLSLVINGTRTFPANIIDLAAIMNIKVT